MIIDSGKVDISTVDNELEVHKESFTVGPNGVLTKLIFREGFLVKIFKSGVAEIIPAGKLESLLVDKTYLVF